MDVAQAAVGLLQVGLEQEGDVAVGTVAFVDLGRQHRKPLRGVGPPLVERRGQHGLGHRRVAGHHPAVEQSELGSEVPLVPPRGPRRGGERSGRGGCLRPTPGTRRRRRRDRCPGDPCGPARRRGRCRGRARRVRIPRRRRARFRSDSRRWPARAGPSATGRRLQRRRCRRPRPGGLSAPAAPGATSGETRATVAPACLSSP